MVSLPGMGVHWRMNGGPTERESSFVASKHPAEGGAEAGEEAAGADVDGGLLAVPFPQLGDGPVPALLPGGNPFGDVLRHVAVVPRRRNLLQDRRLGHGLGLPV